MQDLVGGTVPSAEKIRSLVAKIAELEAEVDAFTVLLTAEQRAATTKMRIGGGLIAAQVGRLASEHGVALPGITVDGMSRDLLLVERIQPLAAAVDKLAQRLADTLLEAQSESWYAATAFYSALARIASANPAIEAALKPVIEFFAVGRRKKAPAPNP